MMRTRTFTLLAVLGLAAPLAACNQPNPPVRSVGGTPIGGSATSGPALTSQGAQDINRDYYLGADPNFPRGSGPGPRGIR